MTTAGDIIKGRIHNPPLEKQAHCDKHGQYLAKCFLGNVWTKCQSCHEAQKQASAKLENEQIAVQKLQEWKNRVQGAGIPERYANSRFDSYKAENGRQTAVLDVVKGYARDWVKNRSMGRCVVMSGSIGTGKNHLACCIAKHVMYKHQATVLFRTADQVARMIASAANFRSEKTQEQVMKELIQPDLLVLDEIEELKPNEKRVFFEVMNERYLAKKPSVLIGNMTKEQMFIALGERIIDRLKEDDALLLTFDWESYRPKIAAGLV